MPRLTRTWTYRDPGKGISRQAEKLLGPRWRPSDSGETVMMPAAKHFDPLLGIDIHLIQPPGGVPPVPIPHPHIGMVFDPMDYVPILGATVLVGGVPRAQAGTSGIALPPHIPMGGVFIKPPANESEVFMGSTTVSVDGDAFSYLSLPALSCQDIGMPPIPRRKKTKTTKSLVLPTTMVLSIPVPVVVGGAPTISRMALGMRAGMAVLGALVSKLKKMRAARKSQNGVHCNGGHPVDVITGANFDEFVDSRSAPPGLFCWRRRYTTAHADRQGGWAGASGTSTSTRCACCARRGGTKTPEAGSSTSRR